MKKKTKIMIGTVLAIVSAVVAGCGKSETYRSIMVYQINGDATITRDRVGEMDAYENLMLQSGDTVAVASDSSMRLKLDDDKYLLAEQDTLMNIVAEGDDADARTYIDLQKGSVTSEIQNKLKDGASYEVNTPNSIMAVRGTIFRVEVEPKEDGDSDTKLTVFQGTVGVRAVLPDGTILDEEVLVEAGEELTINGTVTASDDLDTPTEIDYDSLPTLITEYLKELVQNGQTLAANITQKVQKAEEDQIDRIQEPQIQEAQDAQPGLKEQEQEPELAQQDPEEPKEQNPKPKAQESKTSAKPQKKQPEETQKPQEQEQNPQDPQNPELPQFDPQDPQLQNPQLQDPQQPETEPQKEAPKPNVQNPTPSGDDNSSQESGGGSKKKKTQYYTVTFQYNGSIFGTQKVKKGETATEPKLCPTQNGAWDYDFSQKVTKNIVVEWKAQ